MNFIFSLPNSFGGVGVVAASLAFLLSACGDDSGSNSEINANVFSLQVKSIDELPNCSKNLDGDSSWVVNESAVFVCKDRKWEKREKNDEPESSSSAAKKSESSSSKKGKSSSAVASSNSAKSSDSKEKKSSSSQMQKISSSSAKQVVSSSSVKQKTSSSSSAALSSSALAEKICSSSTAKSNSSVTSVSSSVSSLSSSVIPSSSSVTPSSSSVALLSSSVILSLSSSSKDSVGTEQGRSESAEESSSSVKLSSSSVILSEVEGILTDSRDGQTYKTVVIGSQTWMAQNLNYVRAGSYCYIDASFYCAEYGRLYTWNAARTACPSGWHLPSKDEFEMLFSAVGGQSIAGKMLKSTSVNGTDAYSFSALLAGIRFNGGYFTDMGHYAHFWSSTEYKYDNNNAYNMYLRNSEDNAHLPNYSKDSGFSVRCVKD